MLTDHAKFCIEELYTALAVAKISVQDAILLLLAEDYLTYLSEERIQASRDEVIARVDEMCKSIDVDNLQPYLLKP